LNPIAVDGCAESFKK